MKQFPRMSPERWAVVLFAAGAAGMVLTRILPAGSKNLFNVIYTLSVVLVAAGGIILMVRMLRK